MFCSTDCNNCRGTNFFAKFIAAASVLGADFVRLDAMIRGSCEAVFLSELELYPGNNLSHLDQIKLMRKLLHGYGFDDQIKSVKKEAECFQWTEFEMDEIEASEYQDVMRKSVFL